MNTMTVFIVEKIKEHFNNGVVFKLFGEYHRTIKAII